MVIQVLNSKLGFTIRVSVTSATLTPIFLNLCRTLFMYNLKMHDITIP